MRPLNRGDIVDIAQYEHERAALRDSVIKLKRHRRVSAGDLISLVFENRETMRFQVQEMMRVERIVLDERIQEEIDTYNQLIPGLNEVKATLLIEVTEQSEVKPVLERLQGIDRGGTTFLTVNGDRVEGEFEGGRSSEIKLSAVHYVTFSMSPAQADAARSGASMTLLIDHSGASYNHEVPLGPELSAQLATDLTEAG